MALSNAQKKAIKAVMAQYQYSFDVEEDAIDLRAMAKNFSNGIIPSEKITELINAVLDNKKGAYKSAKRGSVDPRIKGFTPKFAWVSIDLTAVNPIFQRDVAANHVLKIEKDFDPKKIIVPCAVKDVRTGQFLIWDGNHTVRVCERQGWTHVPMWYIEVETVEGMDQDEAEKALILLAGRAFLAINKKNKRAVSQYDEHFISVECGEQEAIIVENIVTSSGCQVARNNAKPGNISHVSGLYSAYDLQTSTGTKGIYLKRALTFHRSTWPQEAVQGVTMQAMAQLYQSVDNQTGSMPDAQFDTEIALQLRTLYGPSQMVYEELCEQYKTAWPNGRDSIPDVVTSGIMLTYTKHVGRANIGGPVATFNVK